VEADNGGDPARSTVLPDDTTVPSLIPSSPVFQWFTQKTARLTFETSELTTARLVLTPVTPSSAPSIEVIESTPKMQHNLLVNSMIPAVSYSVELKITDLGNLPEGNSHSKTLYPTPPLNAPFTAASRNFRGVNDGLIVRELEEGSVSYEGVFPSGPFEGTYEVSGVVDRRPSTVIDPGDSLEIVNNLVLVRALINGIPASASRISDGSVVDTFHVDTEFGAGDSSQATTLPGPFLIPENPSDENGFFAISFTLNGLMSGDTVTLAIEAVGQLLGTEGTIPVIQGQEEGQPFQLDIGPNFVAGFWSFPDTEDGDNLLTPTVNENGRRFVWTVPQIP